MARSRAVTRGQVLAAAGRSPRKVVDQGGIPEGEEPLPEGTVVLGRQPDEPVETTEAAEPVKSRTARK